MSKEIKPQSSNWEDFDKYFAWVLSSGLHGIYLIKPIKDFWEAKIASEKSRLVEEVKNMKVNEIFTVTQKLSKKSQKQIRAELINSILDEVIKVISK